MKAVFAIALGIAFLSGLEFSKIVSPTPAVARSYKTATYVTSEEVAATLSAMRHEAPPTFTIDDPIRVVDVGGYNVGIFMVHRPPEANKGENKVHEGLALDNVTQIVRVIQGEGTLVTGGTLVDLKRMSHDDPDAQVVGSGSRGTVIAGGQSRRIVAGDIVIIPAGVPLGFREVRKSMTYMVIRVDPAKVLPTK